MLIDQITPHFPKDNKEVNMHVKQLQEMLDAAMVTDPVHNQEDLDWGHDGDHRESLHGDSGSSITPREEHGRRCSRDHCDLCDVICARDTRDRIQNQHRDQEREE
jgi:hypothetical protein